MPTINRGHTHAPAVMIGERAAELVRAAFPLRLGLVEGKVALITGASRGIGAAIAVRFARDGAKVVVNYSSSEKEASEVVAEITKAGGSAVAIKANMGNPGEIAPLFRATVEAFGKLDVLVNNAAVMKRVFLPEVTAESFDAHFNVNVRGYLLAAKHAAEVMTAGGSIINVGSAISRMAYPGAVVYTATKGAVDVMTRVLAAEHRLYPMALALYASGAARVEGDRIAYGSGVDFGAEAAFGPLAH